MVFGKYRLVRELGRGGMASVWLAAHTILGAPVAVKILSPEIAAREPRFVARFLREARLAGRIHHPHLAAVHDVGRDPATGLNYMVMEYLPGGSVAGLLARNGPLAEPNALRIVTQVAGALTQAERYGMVHRDIKPDNILFDENGEAKLADLGIAKADLDGHAKTLTQTAAVFGTPAYMSPEQVRDTGKVDIRADIYSLGVVFYEMLSAKRPYAGDSAVTVLLAVAEGKVPPPDLAALRLDLPADTVALIRRMMARDPEDRPRTAAALLGELRALGSASASQALGSALAATIPPPPRPDSPVSAAPTLPAGIAATPESWSETIPMDATAAAAPEQEGFPWRRFLPWALTAVAVVIALVALGVAWALSLRALARTIPVAPAAQPAAVTVAQAPAVTPPATDPQAAPVAEAVTQAPAATPAATAPQVAEAVAQVPATQPAATDPQAAPAAEADTVASATPAQEGQRQKPKSRIVTPSELTTEELVELERARILSQGAPSSKNMLGSSSDDDDLDTKPTYIILRGASADDDSF